MFQTAKSFIATAVIGLYAGPALAHPGHGLQSAVPGHAHAVGDLGVLLGALAVTALAVFLGSRLIGAVRRTKNG